MLRLGAAILSPLRPKFDNSDQAQTHGRQSARLLPTPVYTSISGQDYEPNEAPEDFARDAKMDLMRRATDDLKTASQDAERLQLLTDVLHIMNTELGTKDVFREMDGFLVTLNILSSLRPPSTSQNHDILKTVFSVLALSVHDHQENRAAFQALTGDLVLCGTLETLVSTNTTSLTHVFGCLLAFAANDFAFVGVFVDTDAVDNADWEATIDAKIISSVDVHSLALHNTIGIATILRLLHLASPSTTHAVLKLLDRLVHSSHRNQAVLNQCGIISILFDFLHILPSFIPQSETPYIAKSLKRLLEMGAPLEESHIIFKSLLKPMDAKAGKVHELNTATLDLLRSGMRAAGKWPSFIAFGTGGDHRAGIEMPKCHLNGRTFPGSAGFTFLAWIYVEKLPGQLAELQLLHAESTGWPPRTLCSLKILGSGIIDPNVPPLGSTTLPNASGSAFPTRRWVHIALVHHVARAPNNVRVFLDGTLYATATSPPPSMPSASRFRNSLNNRLSGPVWFLASSHLLLQSLPNELPRLCFTLGPSYMGNFQDCLSKFLTYKTSTSLNIGIQNQKHHNSQEGLGSLTKALNEGIDIKESHIAYSVNPYAISEDETRRGVLVISRRESNGKENEVGEVVGSAAVIKLTSLHAAVWDFGGAAVLLRLVELASTEQELANALSVLVDGLNASWQNSDDMERLNGYTILMSILRSKTQLISLDVFHILLEFLGVDFAAHENTTITNYVAYRIIALDFSFWSLLLPPLQRLHLAHFDMILLTSKFRHFNAKFRFVKFGAVKKLLFVLQTSMYRNEMIPEVISALAGIARQSFSTEATIKPIVSFLAANLEHSISSSDNEATPPSNTVSAVDKSSIQERAEQVLEAFVSILSSDAHMIKFKSALPAPRICLLLLGSKPTPLDLVSFWSVLREVLPRAWDPSVHVAVFDVLFGRAGTGTSPLLSGTPKVVCARVFLPILAVLDHGLKTMLHAGPEVMSNSDGAESTFSPASTTDSYTEVLAEELIELHSTSPSFRSLLQSKPVLSIFIKSAQSFVMDVANFNRTNSRTTRISEKITHLALMCALDQSVDPQQKEEVCNSFLAANIARIIHLNASRSTANTPQPIPSLIRRSISFRQSLRFDTTPAVDRNYLKALDRTNTWRQLIISSEQKRLRKAHQDQREYIRSLHRPVEWQEPLHSQCGLWPTEQDLPMWRIDETEGPVRIRKKLQPELTMFYPAPAAPTSRAQEPSDAEADTQSIMQPDAPPWQESYEYESMALEDDNRWGDDPAEDKNRRVRHELEPGDVVEEVRTVTRIVGVDASPGLLIVGRSHIYMMDGLVQDQGGDIIDARDAPKDVLSVPGTMLELDGRQTAQRWSIEQVSAFSKRSYLFRDVALEIYFRDSRSILVVFSSKQDRQILLGRLNAIRVHGLDDIAPVTATPAKAGPLMTLVGQRLPMTFLAGDEIGAAQRRWQNREISNYTYLSLINQASGRTPNDLTQYPVFPWVLSDYTSERLDLTERETFRDLSKPIGALTQVKREAAEMRYLSLEQVEEVPFHYGTHFSSSMIVSHFLIRMSPFSHYFKVLQGGDWDLPDRLFTDIKRAWDSASSDSRGDVRELIPEFYTCPEFLENLSKLDFGVQTSSSQKIDSVELPPWAKKDPLLFIDLHRQALESDHVSENLPAWIDLIWGYKQRDKTAINVFHPLSYEGAIDLDSITDDHQKEATAGIIHNFGQTPKKLFSLPHPPRHKDDRMYLPIGVSFGIPEDYHLLLQSPKPVRAINGRVAHLSVDVGTESPIPSRDKFRSVSHHPSVHIEWGSLDRTLCLYIGGKIAQVVEATPVTCCDFADHDSLITCLEDTTVCIWRLIPGQKMSLRRSHVMRGHAKAACCIATSRAWSMILTGSVDCMAILWDLNRGRYVRSIVHESPIISCAIQESSGCVATCSRDVLQVHTINGRLITSIRLSAQENIRCLAFHEREYTPIPVLAAGCSDGSIVLRTWNTSSTPLGQKARWEFSTLRVLKCRKEGHDYPTIESLKFKGETLFHGDNFGNVYIWDGN
ncbi:hypothetical protein M407DRAFT_72594 [Tulasnella calospora MUT 4182]|uniref:Beach-domain-containing protein n=1 Tax=Tulasnella calospora MUT 4182 TaxID=1051891 RepID=A0A0C3QBF7_9AGAM|nr:hypothetical protein M407DRAFT_72594 [Tulasnella calospora MUT 4182]